MSNIYKLLKPEGYCVFLVPANSPFYDLYIKTIMMEKYSPYFRDSLLGFIPPYCFDDNPREKLRENLESANFRIEFLEIKKLFHNFKDENSQKSEIQFTNDFNYNFSKFST